MIYTKVRRTPVFWDVFTAVSIIDVSGALQHVALFRTEVLENIPSLSSGVLRLIGYHSYITVETLLLGLSIEEYY
jgi:hypothetical protein